MEKKIELKAEAYDLIAQKEHIERQAQAHLEPILQRLYAINRELQALDQEESKQGED